MCEVDRLPPRQRAVFEFLRDELRRTSVCPSFRDIARHFGIASPNGVTVHLRALERKGFIAQDRGRSRAIRILHHESSCLPLVGVVGAGPLSEAIETVAPFEFNVVLGDGDNAAVVVSDDSMAHQRIVAGDFLIGPQRNGRFQPQWLVRRISD
jgi:repressor LexA